MGEQLVVGPFQHGLKTNQPPFYIDNDAFPQLLNAYAWRGRVKRKRGTSLLSRLTRIFNSRSTSITLDGSGNGNLITGFLPVAQANASIVPGMVTLVVNAITYTDPSKNGTLSPSGSINYASGDITIAAGAGMALTAVFTYNPSLPVMGLEEVRMDAIQYPEFPGSMGFDTTYSYLFDQGTGTNHDVSFYKSTGNALTWSGQDYQQFESCNYQGAFWVTNGTPGMQFMSITGISVTSTTVVNLTIVGHGLVVNDYVFINEVTGAIANTINQQTGKVTNIVNPNTVTVTFVGTSIAGAYTSGGIAQYLTSAYPEGGDGIRWYDGDPTTTGNIKGWVNFAPPLSSVGNAYAIDDAAAAIYYLVGAKVILPFKDRLLFFGPYIQTSSGTPIYLQDYVIYSEVGTPYYTTSSAPYPYTLTTIFNPVLTPSNQTARPQAFWTDQTGYGGFATAGVEMPIKTVNPEKDVLIVGFGSIGQFTQLVYTGNDILPFTFYNISTEWGPESTFSSVTFNNGALTFGNYGLIMAGIEGTQRVDLDIPDQVFQVNNKNNGQDRICGQRDYINEWVYFTYNGNLNEQAEWVYPNQTLFYNYRDQTWGIFNECYTTYGIYRQTTGYTWNTLPWTDWGAWPDASWNSGSSTTLNPNIAGGNQQGFVLLRNDAGTGEGTSLYIQSMSGTTNCVVVSPNHCLNQGDYVQISGCLGSIGSLLNGNVYSVDLVYSGGIADPNSFILNAGPLPSPIYGSNTYLGGGLITRFYVPLIQTKQFPMAWAGARKTRIGRQNYLFANSGSSEVTVNIYLSQDGADIYNLGSIVPSTTPTPYNNALIYSNAVYTGAEYEIEYIYNSILGNLGNGSSTTITIPYANKFSFPYEIVPGSIIIKVGSVATFTDLGNGTFLVTGTGTSGTANYANGVMVLNFSAAPDNTQVFTTTFQYYAPPLQMLTATGQDQIWHRMNTSLIGDTIQVGITMSDAQMRVLPVSNQTAEIELHGFIFDVSPSGVLA